MSASCRPREASRKAPRSCAGFGAQFTRFTPDDWLDEARRIWRTEDGKLVPSYDPALSKTLEECRSRTAPARALGAVRCAPGRAADGHPRRAFGFAVGRNRRGDAGAAARTDEPSKSKAKAMHRDWKAPSSMTSQPSPSTAIAHASRRHQRPIARKEKPPAETAGGSLASGDDQEAITARSYAGCAGCPTRCPGRPWTSSESMTLAGTTEPRSRAPHAVGTATGERRLDLRVHDFEADIEVRHRVPDRARADLPGVPVRAARAEAARRADRACRPRCCSLRSSCKSPRSRTAASWSSNAGSQPARSRPSAVRADREPPVSAK